MSNWFENLGNFMNSNTGKGLSNLAGLGLGAYNVYSQNKAVNTQNDLLSKQNDLSLQNYNYNKSINDREIAKENMSQSNISGAFDSVFGSNSKKKKLGEYYGTTNYEG